MEANESVESLEEMRELAIACFKRGGEDDEEAIMWYRIWYDKRQGKDDLSDTHPAQSIVFSVERANLFFRGGLMEQAREELDNAACEARNLRLPDYYNPIEEMMARHGWKPQQYFEP